MAKGIDWLQIKNEYINSNISYRKLAKKHNVAFSTLEKKARSEKWKIERDKQCDKIEEKVRQKSADVIAKKEADRIKRISSIADRLIDKLEQSTEQLESYIVTNKKRERIVEYKDDKAIGKPTKEIINDTESIKICNDGIIDRQGLKQLASALRDLKEIQSDKNADDDVSIIINHTVPRSQDED